MSNGGWHIIPADTPSGRYPLDDGQMERYDFCGREVTYAKTKFPGNEHVYDWLRVNPHKLNLARIGLRSNGDEMAVSFALEAPASLAAADIFVSSGAWWAAFWEKGGALDLSQADDPRETAEFMADYAVRDVQGLYYIEPR